mmetsp:Transcript_36863/g.85146  ORF Transcript_36863/g.85146 Transcript_36863/m.85146 type:complete len:454 (+) Transcript_36863:204-1565(+)
MMDATMEAVSGTWEQLIERVHEAVQHGHGRATSATYPTTNVVYVMGIEIYVWGYLIASICTVASIVITMLTITQHLLQTRQRQLRTYTIRVLLMVPIYAMEALAGLVLREWSEIFQVWRECYEAFTLFSFMQLMLSYMSCDASIGTKAGAIKVALDMKNNPQIPHAWPMSLCLKPWPMGPLFLRNTLIGVFQYCATMLIVTFLSLCAWVLGIYNTDSFSLNSAYTYLALIQSASQCWALYSLVLFYQASKTKLKPIHPLNKFICIKMVVFFTFWQAVVISFFVHVGIINAGEVESDTDIDQEAEYDAYDTSYWTTSEIANGINDFIVCVEMLGFAIAHIYVFTPNDYVRAERMSVHIGHKDEESYLTTTSHGDSDLFDEDPEMHVTGKRVTGGFQSQRQHILRQLIQGVNFFDLMNDVKTMNDLQTVNQQEKEQLVENQYNTFGGDDMKSVRV